jgi:CheY-like chemotaxis protein
MRSRCSSNPSASQTRSSIGHIPPSCGVMHLRPARQTADVTRWWAAYATGAFASGGTDPMTLATRSRPSTAITNRGCPRAVERVLSKDHGVVGTRSSREALSIASEFQPEPPIIDIRMPDLDGGDVLAPLKVRLPALDVILMNWSVEDLRRETGAGHPQPCAGNCRQKTPLPRERR